MAKKTRTELSTLAINTNLPDNTTELITPTTERAQLTDERESVVNYKDDLGGVPNAGKFITVAVDGESLTMVDEPSGVPDWVTFVTALSNLMKLKSGTNNVQLQFYDSDGTTVGGQITWNESNSKLLIVNSQTNEQISMSGGAMRLTVGTSNILIDSDGVKPSLLWSSIVRGYEGGSIALSTQPTGGALTPRLEISSGGDVGIGTDPTFGKLEVKVPTGTGVDGDNQVVITDGVATNPQEMRLGVNTASNYSYIQSAHRASALADLILNPLAGNVGIGTDSPTAILDVRRGDVSGKIAEFHNNVGFGLELGSSTTQAYINSGSNQSLAIGTNNTAKLTITSGGTVSIGSATATNPLSIRTANGESYLRFLNSDGSNYGDLERSITGNGAVRITTPYFRVTGTLETQLIQSALGIVFDNNSVSGNKTNVTLNAYEEGTWTAIPQRITTAITGTIVTSCNYVKIGKLVYYNIDIDIQAITAQGTNICTIGGLPFTASTSQSRYSNQVIFDKSAQTAITGMVTANVGTYVDYAYNVITVSQNGGSWQVGRIALSGMYIST